MKVVLIAILVGVMLAFTGPALATSTLNVDNTPGCNDSTGSPYYCTIGAAVAASSSGDTISVAAGVGPYVESFGINWGLTLRGPNFGISPNVGSRVGEAVIDGGGSTAIRISTTEPVTIDGFTFSGGTGAFVDSYTTGNKPTIQHNIFTASGDGFFFANSDSVAFLDNYLHDIPSCGVCEGLFLAGNWDGSTGTVASIKSNVWSNLASAGMNLSNVSGTLSGNHFSLVTYYGALLANGTNIDVSGNTFDHTINPDLTVRTWGAGVRFYTPSAGFGARITNNTFSNNYVGIGVRMGSPTADITGLDVHAHQNNFTGSTAAGIRHDGLGTFNATCNWWNSASGPTNAANPGGTGDVVDGSGPVNFIPWLTGPAPSGACNGGTGTPLTSKTQAMNGDQKVKQGSTLSAGFDFTMPGSHPAAMVGFQGTKATFKATCASGTPGSMTITVNIADQSYVDPPNSSAWYPSGDQNSPSTYQGSTTVPSFCDPGALVRLQQGGTFSTNVTSTDKTDKVNVRWHYMDVTGGGWSGTYSVVPS